MKKQKTSKTKKTESLTIPITKLSEPIIYTHDQLLKALYWIWDGFDRCSMPFFLVYNTAEDVLATKQLSGDGVRIGVRNLDWESGSKGALMSFTGEPVEKKMEYEKFMFEGTPVYIYIFPEDACIRNPQTVLYAREYFNVPNTYHRFIEVYGNFVS